MNRYHHSNEYGMRISCSHSYRFETCGVTCFIRLWDGSL